MGILKSELHQISMSDSQPTTPNRIKDIVSLHVASGRRSKLTLDYNKILENKSISKICSKHNKIFDDNINARMLP